MAGEFLVAGKLFKLELQVSVTLGTAKKIDLFAYNPRSERTFIVQVKTLRKRSGFPMRRENVKAGHIYVFVVLNEPSVAEEYYVVPGRDIGRNIDRFFGSSYRRKEPSTFPGILYGSVKPYRDNWIVFDS